MKQRLILAPEDIRVGTFCAVHTGRQDPCPCGCGGSTEQYVPLKGYPLAVTALALPYVAAVVIHANAVAVIDTRECELMRVSEDFARAFQRMKAKEEPDGSK